MSGIQKAETRLRRSFRPGPALDGAEAIIPNETLIASAVTNHTLASRDNRVGVAVQVAYGTDLQRAFRREGIEIPHPRRVVELINK